MAKNSVLIIEWPLTKHRSTYQASRQFGVLRILEKEAAVQRSVLFLPLRPISAHSASTVISSEKSSISTYRKSTTRFPTSHR